MLTDRFGNDIKVGSHVTYPTRSGSSLDIIDGVVEAITTAPVYSYEPDGERKTVLKVRAPKQYRYGDDPETTLRTVGMIDRVTVVILPTPGNQHEMGS